MGHWRNNSQRAKSLCSAVALLLWFSIGPAFAVNPDEVLADPALEQRARNLSGELRCMVCQNESIDDSNAELARDLRVLVRERLTSGDSDEQVLDYVVARYGEFVLLRPRLSSRTLMLWGFPIVVLLIGGAALFLSARRKPASIVSDIPLTDAEKARLAEILDEH